MQCITFYLPVGRAFAVNYRKAPQYPWPCPLQDVLAACMLPLSFIDSPPDEEPLDLYLIQPPVDAVHKAIPPSKIVFAGDSAGGGLALSTLAILRDMGLPMPAGAVLISPWVDLTHSFPSVMQNVGTVCTHAIARPLAHPNLLLGYYSPTWFSRETVYIVANRCLTS